MDLNIVFLQGKIGNDLQYKKTSEGAQFATFSVVVNSFSKDIKDSTERRTETYIRVMCFDKYIVEYLQRVNAKQGNKVSVLARLNSHKSEYKGISFIQNDVIARDVIVVKVKDVDAPQSTQQENTQEADPYAHTPF